MLLLLLLLFVGCCMLFVAVVGGADVGVLVPHRPFVVVDVVAKLVATEVDSHLPTETAKAFANFAMLVEVVEVVLQLGQVYLSHED
jgi:hypothetical protein